MDDQRIDPESGESGSDTTERKRFRFNLKGLLLIMTAIACCLGAYLEGYRSGYKAAKDESKTDYIIWKSPQK
jgi:hypothetical protein